MSESVNCVAQSHVRSLPGHSWSRESHAGPLVACDVKASRRSRTTPRFCIWLSATRERVLSRSRRWSLAMHDRLRLMTRVAWTECGSGGTSGKIGEARPQIARELSGRVLGTSRGSRAGHGISAWFFRGCSITINTDDGHSRGNVARPGSPGRTSAAAVRHIHRRGSSERNN